MVDGLQMLEDNAFKRGQQSIAPEIWDTAMRTVVENMLDANFAGELIEKAVHWDRSQINAAAEAMGKTVVWDACLANA